MIFYSDLPDAFCNASRVVTSYAFDNKELRLALPTEKGTSPGFLRIAVPTSGRAGLMKRNTQYHPIARKNFGIPPGV